MATLLFDHPAGLGHDTGPYHPESPARLVAITDALAVDTFRDLGRRRSPRCDPAPILRVHPATYVAALEAATPGEGLTYIDDDTPISRGSWEAMLHAAGGVVAAVDAVMRGEAANAFVMTRPPGHHASRTVPMGFCLLNNAAIAIRHAQAAHGAERVAIVDFDVHHGNGTQAIFWADASVLYCSTHEMPLFPGTGAASETGTYGTIVNAPLAPGSDGAIFREACESVILPRLIGFAPDAIVISAGFDAHWRDPLASLNLTEMDFAWITAEIMEIAARSAGGRIISVLEGGYDLEGLGASAAAHVATLMGRSYFSPSTGS
ncbi:MAG: histone deacetylase family protein [Methylovirgula sp.]|nr:histone deacetylase family protein [Methylovirgula sp.]